ncbi:MAG TPA: TolC family protein, partial [bacterium]|nr:TolC family protein [bacterium]
TYSHPLLRNRNGFLDRLQYDLKQFDIDYSEIMAAETLEGFLTRAAEKYLDWVLLSEQQRIGLERQRLAEEELQRTRRMRAANLIDEVDVIRAENAVSFAMQNVMFFESQRNGLRAELAELAQDETLYTMTPSYQLYETIDLDSLETVIARLQKESRLLRPLRIRIEQLELARRGYEENTKPELSAFARVYLSEIDNVYIQSYGIDKPDATVGLRFSVPLEKRTARHNISKTSMQITQLNHAMTDLLLDLTSALTNLYVRLTELEEVLQLNREQIRLAAAKTEEEFKLYQQGRGELTFVIQSRDEEENAKLIYAQNALTYHKLVLQVRSLTDEVYE